MTVHKSYSVLLNLIQHFFAQSRPRLEQMVRGYKTFQGL